MKAQVDTVVLYSGITGRRIRKATKVTLEAGCVVTFLELWPKGKAIEAARKICAERARAGLGAAKAIGRGKWTGTRR